MSALRAVDTHAHLDFPEFAADRDAVIAQLRDQTIGVINISTSIESVAAVDRLSRENDLIWGLVGLHPTDITAETFLQLPSLLTGWDKLFAANPKLVGVGEIGLDYFHDRSTEAANRQKAALRQLLTWAKESDRPISFHCRDAYGDLATLLGDYPGLRGVIHCFSGTFEQAQAVLTLGFHLSFTAMITYPKNEELRQIVAAVPLEKILLETDSPFLSPQSRRGQRNDPTAVVTIAELIAELKNTALDEVLTVTTSTAKALFGLNRN